jgi:K+-transporting ATPase ATPase C chain
MIFFSGIYTCFIWGIAQALPNNGRGEIIVQDGKTYYTNIGQLFTEDRYFNSRPSAVNYNASSTGGSNKAPSNPIYLQEVQNRIDTILLHNPGINKSEIPSDLVTASGSGIDPNISVQAATIQIKRIAKIRNISENKLSALITEFTEKPLFNFLGTEKINTLKINLALDNLK